MAHLFSKAITYKVNTVPIPMGNLVTDKPLDEGTCCTSRSVFVVVQHILQVTGLNGLQGKSSLVLEGTIQQLINTFSFVLKTFVSSQYCAHFSGESIPVDCQCP